MKLITSHIKLWLIVVAIIAFALGYWLRGPAAGDPGHAHAEHPGQTKTTEDQQTPEQAQTWTCSMHPQIQQKKPGQCPICGMDLVPVTGESSGLTQSQIEFSETALELMEVQTTPVQRKFVEAAIRLNGKIDYDETRVKYITAWVGGRIDALFADFTGTRVEKGDHMVKLYSPELLSAQAELLQAADAVEKMKPDISDLVRKSNLRTLESAREKLRLMGLKPEQIKQIEQNDKPLDHLTIHAPASGVVIHKNATEGMYVDIGTKIYTIADLSHMWAMLDVYESDMEWLRYGQQVEFTAAAYPGEKFTGKISFIDPRLNPATRTVKVRVNVDNHQLKLKPQMFVRAIVRPQVAKAGRVMDPSLAGKWICPMHPSIIKKQNSQCDICGMDLVTTESLGYTVADKPEQAPLVIPDTAPLITGKRAVVYVRLEDRERPTFEGREVVLGPEAGDHYIVRSGLTEGEKVVTNGNFKIDSALQIQAKKSMMSQEESQLIAGISDPLTSQADNANKEPNDSQTPEALNKQLAALLRSYSELSSALAEDDAQKARHTAQQTRQSLANVDMKLMTHKAHKFWMQKTAPLEKHLTDLAQTEDINSQRKTFWDVSKLMIDITEEFSTALLRQYYVIECPMAFDNAGARWLQTDETVRNPYFGSSMFKCGEVVKQIPEE